MISLAEISGMIVHCAFHDAEIVGLSFFSGRRATIQFEHIDCYVRIDSENFEVWSLQASVGLCAVTAVDFRGAVDEGGVLEGKLCDQTRQQIRLVTPESIRVARYFEMISAQSQLTVEMGSASLDIVGINEFRKIYRGDLR